MYRQHIYYPTALLRHLLLPSPSWGWKLPIHLALAALILTASNPSPAEANDAPTLPFGCEVLQDALEKKQITQEFYTAYCGDQAQQPTASNVFSSVSADQTIQAIVANSPSMMSLVKSFGKPEKIVELLSQNSLDGQRSLMEEVNWTSHRELVEYITSSNVRDYFQILNGADGGAGSGQRYTTLFWVAFRSKDPFFMRQVLYNKVRPYRLEQSAFTVQGFPCAANLYLCIVKSSGVSAEQKQDLIGILNAYDVAVPTWTRTAATEEFISFELKNHNLPNNRVCDLAGSGDCTFAMQILRQARVPVQGERQEYLFTDYAGYDAASQRHLFSGLANDEIFACWISSAAAVRASINSRRIELISQKAMGGRISQYRDQIGKRVQYRDSLHQNGFLVLDGLQSKFEIKIVDREFR
ncbi:MAG: hypothetical protein HC850_06195 [Rhodomicrobium sp.]|nr:hypothetical protein [Rhodomicrobium sp.]